MADGCNTASCSGVEQVCGGNGDGGRRLDEFVRRIRPGADAFALRYRVLADRKSRSSGRSAAGRADVAVPEMGQGAGSRQSVGVRAARAHQPLPQRCPQQQTRVGRLGDPDSWDGVDIAERVAISRTVWQLVGELGQRQRAAVVLRYFHGQSDDEITAGIGCRRGTARSLISRGLAAIRASLDEQSGRCDLGAERWPPNRTSNRQCAAHCTTWQWSVRPQQVLPID